MADVGDELLTGVFQLLDPGQIVEDEDGAVMRPFAIENGGGVDFEPAFVHPGQFEGVVLDDALLLEPLHEAGQFRKPECLQNGLASRV